MQSANDIRAIIQSLNQLEAQLLQQKGQDGPLTPMLTDGMLLTLELQLRRARDAHFPVGYFADAAWEILLELEQARRQCTRMSISDIGLGAGVAPTTVLRYIDRLVADGIVERRPDPLDRRRVFIALTKHGQALMAGIFVGVVEDRSDRQTLSMTEHANDEFREYPGVSVFAQ
jgi:DNA-binding MarR family transcriptional regulator